MIFFKWRILERTQNLSPTTLALPPSLQGGGLFFLDKSIVMCNNYSMIKLKQHDPRYKINTAKKVFVYKNLHKDCWSIKQGGLVKAHAHDILLYETSFKVNRAGREKVIKEKRKNVHAGVVGYLDHPSPEYATWDDDCGPYTEVTYNPYKYKSFVEKATEKPRWFSPFVKLTHKQVLVA